ncbi:hypothetical protein FACS189431_5370 [Alphaproteobacteria bacterium]|nr:hypothetical protein FACS189431_5370 [Alphaproteobacteria bacterium]
MKKYRIIIPQGVLPEKFELTAAGILLNYFKDDIEFVPRGTSSTPDFTIKGTRWELKSPVGKGKRNIQHQFNRAAKQSKNIIFDARRSKMDIRKIRHQLNYFATKAKRSESINRLLLINKEGNMEKIK